MQGGYSSGRDTFGENIALLNNTVIASVYSENPIDRSPQLRVFTRDADNDWSLQAVLHAQGLTLNSRAYVSVHGNTALMQVDKKTVMYVRDNHNKWQKQEKFNTNRLRVEHNRLWLASAVNGSGGTQYLPLGYSNTPSMPDDPNVSGDDDGDDRVPDDNNCSYEDALANGGWGWDSVNHRSCPPHCVDTDGDGWGWDGVKSCRTSTPEQCVDTDGDGWGWDGRESCRMNAVNQCIDTDGHGWGWTGRIPAKCDWLIKK